VNILLIAHSFPPDAVVGSLRAAKVAEAFRQAGHHVDVITAKLPGETSRVRVAEAGVAVHVVRRIPHPLHLYRWAKARFAPGGHSGPSLSPPVSGSDAEAEPATRNAERVLAWKRYLVSALWVPDEMQGFIVPALLRSRALFRRGVDLVYTTSPPHSDHLVGLLLKKMYGVKWIAEFRDPWTDCGLEPQWQSAGANALNQRLERQCLRSADHVVAVSEGIADLLAPRIKNADAGRLIVARSGIENLAPAAPPPAHGRPFRIVYLGNLYKGRDPLPFLKAVAAVKDRHDLGAADLRVDFIGSCERFRDISVRQVADELGISDLVTLRGWVPHAEGQAALQQADLLLLLAQEQPRQVPNKLYEYLGTRKPILAMADDDGETARMLRAVGGQYVVTDDGDGEVERVIESAMGRYDRVALPPVCEETLAEWTTERQMQQLLQRIGVVAPPEPLSRRHAMASR
jgi:glycosyltransferase involved in cell wall biosynthesis